MIEWLKHRIMGAALSAAATITFLSLISPAWLDFFFDIAMILIIWVVGKLSRAKS